MTENPPRPFQLLVALLGSTPDPDVVARAERRAPLAELAVLTLVGLALYGAGAGLFQGGEQVLIASLKTPLLVIFALLLTLPSLAVTTALTGATWTVRRLLLASLAFTSSLTLVLAALLPIAWLFSVSSRFLLSPVVVHLSAWVVAVLFARRALRTFLYEKGSTAFKWWTALFLVVSIQSATFLQPVLYRSPGEPLFPRPRRLFVQHFRGAMGIGLADPAAAERAAPRTDTEVR